MCFVDNYSLAVAFCVITMFPAYLNYRKDQPSFDITQISDPGVITVHIAAYALLDDSQGF